MTIFLDAGILGLLTHKNSSSEVQACIDWLENVSLSGHRVVVAEINDYELRRSLIKIRSKQSLAALDVLISRTTYLPITTPVMRRAATLWAETRSLGHPLAHPHALDCDVILLAQVREYPTEDSPVVIATTDVSDLNYFADARLWQDITP